MDLAIGGVQHKVEPTDPFFAPVFVVTNNDERNELLSSQAPYEYEGTLLHMFIFATVT